ncbi:MAG: nucleoside triphosphate pyrophosphohydrolase [Planctomycetes bacterium]|nr:nucleoside triphosphate pyrophosphohydrolase [Planctomycetota bacterium]
MVNEDRLKSAICGLASVMSRLRRECPWDRRQSHASLRRYLIEECHEVLDALDREDQDDLRAELGDLLFQIWFHAELASEDEAQGFDLADVIQGVHDKLVRRHPHVFEDETARDADWVRKNWERMKLDEGRRSRLEGLPPGLPALLAAQTIQDKASRVGFDWADYRGALDKLQEELGELQAELPSPESKEVPSPALTHELGDVLFTIVNLARHLGVVAEDALRTTNQRFCRRFRGVEELAQKMGQDLEGMDVAAMEELWQQAKAREING